MTDTIPHTPGQENRAPVFLHASTTSLLNPWERKDTSSDQRIQNQDLANAELSAELTGDTAELRLFKADVKEDYVPSTQGYQKQEEVLYRLYHMY